MDDLKPVSNTPVKVANYATSGAVTLAENVLELALTMIPYVGWIFKLPGVKQLVAMFIEKYGSQLTSALEEQFDGIIIDKQTFAEGQAARREAEALRANFADAAAQKAFDDKYRDLIRMQG